MLFDALNQVCLCSLADKAPVFGTGNGGSIPSRGTLE